jgi:hypothetical protein
MDNDHPDEPESYVAGQTKRGTRYFEVDLQGQRSWYSARASACKRRADGFALIVITAGSLTTFVAALGDGAWIKPVTAALGTTVAVAEGWMGVSHCIRKDEKGVSIIRERCRWIPSSRR